MAKQKKYKENVTIPWVIDENLKQNSDIWRLDKHDPVHTLKDLNLLATQDMVISKELNKRFPGGKIILTANRKPDEKGDYFLNENKEAIVKFSSDINTTTLQLSYLGKFRNMVNKDEKLLGADITLTKEGVVFKKGSKVKKVKYKRYI